MLKKIAAALDCTAAELLGEDAPATPLTPIQKLWLGLLENLPPTRVPDACAQVARLAAESDPTDAMTRVPALAGND